MAVGSCFGATRLRGVRPVVVGGGLREERGRGGRYLKWAGATGGVEEGQGGSGGSRLKMNCRPSLNYMSSASLLPLRSVSTVAFRFHSKFQFR